MNKYIHWTKCKPAITRKATKKLQLIVTKQQKLPPVQKSQ